ncbi:elongation factor 4 [Nocardia farcinica]|uniref:Elongation factor 4 n=2 Tax=Nocardia farcinica TaxID=37329 RepID=LEPA_NOCFA|nr:MULTISPECIES: translation elongation factor 4 [Nocardia]Q5YZZ7.1 RecName: Full=Elongation factor 4; Short=EF-4; AltName: Full=Ribosomal back-translocase LepA [Nocardia farcinica IFM 10152]AXK85920.1 elongation factor 4 [Nocardia farcinica]MBA4859314.1 elongation factor 4 [Nocardia farcinica]MBC9816152.1 elongation factor 4 [Nocardia farcinica]MBF6068258.1 elongation factor 4 [Nocardia farcinica]MBF6140518.1 elongation factor 4 [Nocardia farcinica]
MPASFADTTFTDPSRIRNFCIIAHIDHGKSTLADRMLQLTGVVEERAMRAQYLDRMDIERERGITIKAQNVRLPWRVDDTDYVMHLIDTPGHVDFTYEVSRALEACEGAILLVDAAQGIEAQTLANLYLALDKDLTIIPVLNKIDLPAADPDRYAAELAHIVGCEPSDVLRVSGKTGVGVPELLDEVIRQVPPPVGDADAPARAMIFDSVYDTYRGVVTYVRVVDGKLTPREKIKMMSTGATHELLEIGIVSPEPKPTDGLGVGEVGYLITGVKDVRQSKVGDTVTAARNGAAEPLTGYREPRPMVYSGLYPVDGSDYPDLRDALEKLQLNDAALSYTPETSVALGFGFRCGFLGLLHMEITRERLQREFDLDLISTAPNVVYRVEMEDGTEHVVTNPSYWPEGKVRKVFEPVVKCTIISPSEFIGSIMELCQSRRGELGGMDYLSETRVELRYTLPMAEIIFDFFDSLKSRTRGYASLDYEESGEQESQLVKVDILLQGEAVDAFSAIVHKDAAQAYGHKMTTKLRELIPRQQFEVPIQAAIGSKIIARENIRAIRKDVLAKCYGGDISRKRKLLEKQKEGKKRMKTIGRVDVPQEAFVAALSSDAQADKPKDKK